MIYKIVSSSAQIPEPIKNRFKSMGRALDYYNSRLALQECLKEIGIQKELNHLEITNHHYLKEDPKILVSIAHTNKIGAALISNAAKFKSVGIDIEFKDRKIKEKTSKFFVTKSDKNYANLLALWQKKEAAFKALSPLTSKEKFVLTDIWVDGDKFRLIDEDLSGTFTVTSQHINANELLIVIATV